jgi:hypothetical protein
MPAEKRTTGSQAGLAKLEVSALFLLLMSYIWGWQGAFPGSSAVILSCSLGLVVCSNFLVHGDTLRTLGLRLDNLWISLVEVGTVTAILGLFLASVSGVLGTRRSIGAWSASHTAALLLWAFVQQYALQGFLHTRLREIFYDSPSTALYAAVIFALLHLPNPTLMACTLLVGFLWCLLFRRHPNLFTLTMSHAALTAMLSLSFPREWLHGMRVGPGYFHP